MVWPGALLGLLACGPTSVPAPAEVSAPLHRLSREEWERSVGDLLGVARGLTRGFSVQDPSGVFSNASDLQADGEMAVDQFVVAAQEAVASALAPLPDRLTLPADGVGLSSGWPLLIAETGTTWWAVGTSSVQPITIEVPFAGTWTVAVPATRYVTWLDTLGPVERESPRLILRDPVTGAADEVVLEEQDPLAPARVSLVLDLVGGAHTLEVEVVTTGWWGPLLAGVELSGVPDDPADRETSSRAALRSCPGEEPGTIACARAVLRSLGRRTWRRPLSGAELAGLVDQVAVGMAGGVGWEEALRPALEALFASPHFLFRVEIDPPGVGAGRALDPFEVAARLSLFLWSSAPDDLLLDCAAAGGLGRDDGGPCGLDAQVARMLGDPRADALVEVFAMQWLGADDVSGLTRAEDRYPLFDDELARSMQEETRRVLHELRRDGRPVAALLTQRWTWIDRRLAEIYGVQAPEVGFERYDWPDGAPAGILRHASVLTVSSQASRTSPVQRGVYVTGRLLCDAPPPPPAGIPPLDESVGPLEALDAHKRPGCVECHDHFEPYGLALEGYDAIGAARSAWPDGTAISAVATFSDGRVLDGLAGVAAAVAEGDAFRSCFVEHLSQYALARTWGEDLAVVRDTMLRDAGSDAGFDDVVRAVARSDAFLRRARVWP